MHILDIGLNAYIDQENIQNVHFEKFFNFYGLLEPISESNDIEEPDKNLRLIDQVSPEYMDEV